MEVACPLTSLLMQVDNPKLANIWALCQARFVEEKTSDTMKDDTDRE